MNEYNELRKEILENMKTQQQLSTATIGLTVSILTVVGSFKDNNPYLYLIPLLLLLPSAVKIRELKDGIMTLSAYLIAKYESSSNSSLWETDVNLYRKKYSKNRSMIMVVLEGGEFAIAGVICELFYISANFARIKALEIVPIIFCILSLFAIVFIFYLTLNYQNMDFNTIEEQKKRWESILQKKDKP